MAGACRPRHPLLKAKAMALDYPETNTRTTEYLIARSGRPWQRIRKSRVGQKQACNRKERRRVRRDPECLPMHDRNSGWDY